MTYEEAVIDATNQLEHISSTARLDAEVLMAYALDIDRTALHVKFNQEIQNDEYNRFCVFLERRKLHEPIAYILARKEFWGLEFIVNHSVLVPRPESELLVEEGLNFLATRDSEELTILDLGTGSGCLAISIAHELKKQERPFSVLAVDTSADALEVAADNVLKHGLGGDVLLLEGSWFSEIDPSDITFDLIVSNPPYVSVCDTNLPEDLNFEPREALFSGVSGTEDIEYIMKEAPRFLKPGGELLIEIGDTQRSHLIEAFATNNKSFSSQDFLQDLAGLDRVMRLQK